MPIQLHERSNVPPSLGRGMRLLREGARDLGLCLTTEHVRAFEIYYRELGAWNRRFNLTTVTRYEDVQLKHFLDSLTCLLALPVPGADRRERLPNVVPLSSKDTSLLCVDVGTGDQVASGCCAGSRDRSDVRS